MKKTLPWLLVGLQFALLGLIAVLVVVPHDRLWGAGPITVVAAALAIVGGGVLAVLGVRGLGSSLTASPVPLSGSGLVTSGIYSRVRHPIYSGLLLGALGLVVLGASVWQIVGWIALLALLMLKSRWEERMLGAVHPGYAGYAATAGRFVPGVGRLR